MPGGARDPGESLSHTAVRETREETGEDIQPTGIVGIFTDPTHVIHYTSNDEVRQEFTVVYRGQPIVEDRWRLRHRTGVDLGNALIVRAGVRDNNDLVSIGDAPNIAAKLSDAKKFRTTISDLVYDKLDYNCKYGGKDEADMWTGPLLADIGGGRTELIHGSNWKWGLS